ncbi:hypothetical protein TVAG_276820 [Trichomonas vaginalis G3]|uniref:Uncharacterized protein n=1 Tax=Trichomonas vaginalis (strain ATCC PRA-98 / G3) TaxID=412133 RepID=A2FUE2_TRIV3|nr:hypothetical protein TVAGG3_0883930 [Trichomonas vaginalis G3]EAX91463.1 hypothetical protein TVAG_276820 [Trichomonas vaginalis G3]KAI5502249.1 hypothetical protein TVAGG3_0883930 [Trichomonas vaginalis G3]|eukprot:XP_001304393.1 hypothetical protein [Trichomonas vaginalis G3]
MTSIAIWDCTTCPAANIDFLQQITKNTKTNKMKIFAFSENSENVPMQLFEMQNILDVIIRFGEMALFDIVSDVITSIRSIKEVKCIYLATNNIQYWITPIETIKPSEVQAFTALSQQEFNEIISFSFLDLKKYKYNRWSGEKQIVNPIKPQKLNQPQQIPEEEEEFVDDMQLQEKEAESDHFSQNEEEETVLDSNIIEEEEDMENEINDSKNSFNSSGDIKPLVSIENEQIIDLRSPAPAERSTDLISRSSPLHSISQTPRRDGDTFTIPHEFQALVESMKAVGKAMIPMNALIEEYKKTCSQLGTGDQNLLNVIQKASDQGFVIFDSTINYIRFRDRKISFSKINYE